MDDFRLTTPVVFAIFNNPNTTKLVFEEIRKAKPPKLLVIADGPRQNKPDEADKCAATRAVIEGVDWDCEVLKNYSDVNLGCGKAVAGGIDWVFSIVEEAIILEHDCLPHPTFFRYCQELLERYRDDGRIMTISGDNFQFGRRRNEYSYYFSHFSHIWGWATWRRAWQNYDFTMKLWPEVRDGRWLTDIFARMQAEIDGSQSKFQVVSGMRATEYWHDMFENTYAGKVDTWDYQLLFACLTQNRLNILPNVNLVSNIGFGPEATHTVNVNQFTNMPVWEMKFPLNHPPFVIRDAWADEYTQVHNFA